MWKVAGAPPKTTGAPGLMTCVIVTPASTSTVWNTVAPIRVTGRDQAHERDGDDLNGDPRLHAVEKVLARVLAVAEVSCRGDREDRQRPGDEIGAIGAEELKHLRHPRHAVLRERTRDDGLGGVLEAETEAPGVRDVGGDVIRREGGCEIRDVVEPVRQPDVLDEVGGGRMPGLSGAVIGDPEAARAGNEVDVVTADLGVWVALTVVERERRGGRADRLVDHVGREQDALACGVGGEPCVEEPLAERGPADLHPDLSEDTAGLVQDLGGEIVIENAESRAHCPPSSPKAGVDSGAIDVHAYMERPFHIAE